MTVPAQPKLYHIVHVDRLPSILADGHLWSDAEVQRLRSPGTTIGLNRIKERRLTELTLQSHPDLHVGECVPFYFCPRSVMLYLIDKANTDGLQYRGGQGPIVHLEFDLHAVVEWAEGAARRWAFTLSNAGSYYFEDRADLQCLGDLDWSAIHARQWSARKETKQAEFLVEHCVPWALVERIGVHSPAIRQSVLQCLATTTQRPRVEVVDAWYY